MYQNQNKSFLLHHFTELFDLKNLTNGTQKNT